MSTQERFIIVAHRGDGRYRALDAIGARFYLRESAAQAKADKLNADSGFLAANPTGAVVRSLVDWRGTEVVGNRIHDSRCGDHLWTGVDFVPGISNR